MTTQVLQIGNDAINRKKLDIGRFLQAFNQSFEVSHTAYKLLKTDVATLPKSRAPVFHSHLTDVTRFSYRFQTIDGTCTAAKRQTLTESFDGLIPDPQLCSFDVSVTAKSFSRF